MDAASQIHTALNEWLFAFLLLDAHQTRRLDVKALATELTINTLDENGNQIGRAIKFSNPINERNLSAYFSNLVLNATGICSIKAAAAMEEIWGKNPNQVHEPDIRSAFGLVKLIRHAWAHNPSLPTWLLNHKGDRVVWRVGRIGLEVDLRDKEGLAVDGRHFGDWGGFYQLIEFCEQVTRNHRRE